MRPIKFRAWDKEKNKMFEPTYQAYAGELEDLLIPLKGDLILRKLDETIHESLFPDRFILMQSTGLKDKNGVEIYEGDIVNYFVKSNSVIEWKNGGFIIKRVLDGAYEIMQSRIAEMEVIGSIYENKELLKEQNK